MRKIELELEGVVVKAQLLDKSAPKTCQALWDILPFEDMVTHAKWSGGRMHTNNHAKLKIDARKYPIVENPSMFQAPGDVVIMPLNKEISINYAPGNFCWLGQQWIVTHVATIEGDMSKFARKMERLQWEGAKKLIIRRGSLNEAPAPIPAGKGTIVKIECEGKEWIAELFTDKLPKLGSIIVKALPLKGTITNMHSSGEIFHLWASIPVTLEDANTKLEREPVDYKGSQIGDTGVAYYDPRDLRGTGPGDILLNTLEGLRIVHGQVQNDQSLSGRGSDKGRFGSTQKVGRIIKGSIEELHELSKKVEWEGAKMMRVSLLKNKTSLDKRKA